MPYISVDIDLDDIYRELRDREKQTLVDWLKEDGYLTKRDTEYEGQKSVLQELFEEDVAKIRRAYLTMSREDMDIINQIAKKY
jgi:phosphoribosyl-ATP pyrophosphohydrolase